LFTDQLIWNAVNKALLTDNATFAAATSKTGGK